MEIKQITLRDDEQVIEQFSEACKSEGTNMSAEVRKFMRRFNRRHEQTTVTDNTKP